jgi:hypothetical protein
MPFQVFYGEAGGDREGSSLHSNCQYREADPWELRDNHVPGSCFLNATAAELKNEVAKANYVAKTSQLRMIESPRRWPVTAVLPVNLNP